MFKKSEPPAAFVTYSWCRSSYNVVKSLGKQGISVHVGDHSSYAMSRFSKYAKSFTKLPDFFEYPDLYFKSVCDALIKTNSKVLLPGHEDIGIFSKRKNELPVDIHVVLPNFVSYNLAEDKEKILEFASLHEIPTPFSLIIEPSTNIDLLKNRIKFPMVVKTRIGNSGKGVRIVHSISELKEKINELVRDFDLADDRWPVIQEFLTGDSVGVCVLYDNGKCVAACAEKYLRCKEPERFGTSTYRITYDNPQLISTACKLMEKLNWNGVAQLDFIADQSGIFRLIEVNPRLWGALALSINSGIDFPLLWYYQAIKNTQHEKTAVKKIVKCKWIVGELSAAYGLLKTGNIKDCLKIFSLEKNCCFDDLDKRDLLPFVFELIDYGIKFIKAKGSLNPTVKKMIR